MEQEHSPSYKRLRLSDVFLSWAGYRAKGDPLHKAISALVQVIGWRSDAARGDGNCLMLREERLGSWPEIAECLKR